jgi:DNA-directed RNA polymerase specialized sigma subunit
MGSTTTKSKRLSSKETVDLWARYKGTGDPRLRDRLVLTFAPMVKYIVYRKAREIPAHCEVDDFLSCGLEAVIKSIDRFGPAKGATLERYAWTRVVYNLTLREIGEILGVTESRVCQIHCKILHKLRTKLEAHEQLFAAAAAA